MKLRRLLCFVCAVGGCVAPFAADAGSPASRPAAATQAKEPALQSGDRVRISIYDLVEPGREWLKEFTIDATSVGILYIGDVTIAGLTPQEAAEKIAKLGLEKHVLLPKSANSAGPRVEVTRVAAAATSPAK